VLLTPTGPVLGTGDLVRLRQDVVRVVLAEFELLRRVHGGGGGADRRPRGGGRFQRARRLVTGYGRRRRRGVVPYRPRPRTGGVTAVRRRVLTGR
jgi:hypothetical protein